MNLTLSAEPGIFLTNSSPGMRAYLVTAFVPHDVQTDRPANDSLLANLTGRHNGTSPVTYDPLGGHTVWQVVMIVFLCGSLSLVTIIGNILVLVSFKVNKQLKTVNNYYLLSLAFADLIIGVLSMNLYTTYIIMNQWTLGNWACDLWLAIDYVASNASVMNLLVISFDRYFSVTRPLTYRAKRTTKRAMTMIGLAWSISFILWAPAILFWQYFVGKRTVKSHECYIQFLSEPITTFCTAIAAFYLPVTIMTVLYWRIYRETENRSKELAGLKGSGNQGNPEEPGSSRSHSSYELHPSSKRSSGKMKAGRLWFWPSSRTSGSGDTDRSSSDSWNNNETAVSIDQSDDDEEEYIEDARPIYSVTLEGRRDSESLQPTDTEARPSRKGCSSALKDQPNANISHKDTKRFTCKTKTQVNKRKKMSLVKEKKAAQTLSAILLAFIITWTPYNIMVLLNAFCDGCIPATLWALGYWLCYVNSTVNPMCYALCNKTFRTTFRSILLCQWRQKKPNKPHIQQRQAAATYRKQSPD
ncbi:muscarinic acetylcholine receptor M3-like [Ctenopharyngodon idella]|uniref:muscarinic acetylcholine receptor M3-like n=1 Tax=Ctenopharyngodon idella TaxID=7959 RepID=UPI00223086A9|nr:muscarinic acetylcholine receptor M3-like [Ctenopharyngodon idella]XP_051770450.1 muscarinic acetylcholine receptor M3-like [Ctenopharyngodon idella]